MASVVLEVFAMWALCPSQSVPTIPPSMSSTFSGRSSLPMCLIAVTRFASSPPLISVTSSSPSCPPCQWTTAPE